MCHRGSPWRCWCEARRHSPDELSRPVDGARGGTGRVHGIRLVVGGSARDRRGDRGCRDRVWLVRAAAHGSVRGDLRCAGSLCEERDCLRPHRRDRNPLWRRARASVRRSRGCGRRAALRTRRSRRRARVRRSDGCQRLARRRARMDGAVLGSRACAHPRAVHPHGEARPDTREGCRHGGSGSSPRYPWRWCRLPHGCSRRSASSCSSSR